MIIVFMLTFLKVYEDPNLFFCHAKIVSRYLACRIHGENKPIPSVPTKGVALGESRTWRRNDNTELQSPMMRGDGEGQTVMIWFLIRMKCDMDEIGQHHTTVLEVGAEKGRISTGKARRHGEMTGGGGITAVIIAKKNILRMIRSVGNDQAHLKTRFRVPCIFYKFPTSGFSLGIAFLRWRPKSFLGDEIN